MIFLSRRSRHLCTALLIAVAVTSTGLPPADARPGGGYSVGSRGSRTYSAPSSTSIAPYGAAPMQRSITPGQQRYYGATPTSPAYGGGYVNRHPFMTGLAGGFLGAGLFGLLSGHGFFGGMHGGGFFGFLIQMLLLGFLISWLIRRFGAGRNGAPTPMPSNGYTGNGPNTGLQITPDDYRAFQQNLLDIQAAWSAQNISALSRMATPEMVSYFNEQLSAYASRNARNFVSNVQFLQGDLSESWREGNLEYATVAMRYSLIDVTTDLAGNVIDGSSTEPVTVTEFWTFVRNTSVGANWILSAIQQTR